MRKKQRRIWLAVAIVVVGLIIAGCVVPQLDDATFNLEGQFAGILVREINSLLSTSYDFLLETPNEYLNSAAFMRVYNWIAFVVGSLVALLLVWRGIRTLAGGGGVDLPNIIARLIVVSLALKLTPWAIRLLTQGATAVSRQIINMTDGLVLNNGMYPAAAGAAVVMFLGVYLVMLFRLTLFYVVRNYRLLFMAALSPLAWLFYVDNEHRTKMWFSEIIALLGTQIVHSLQIVICVLLVLQVPVDNKLTQLGLQIGALSVMNTTPNWLQGYVMQSPPVTGLSRLLGGARDASSLNQLVRWVAKGGRR